MYFKPCWTRCGRFFYDSLNSLDFFLFVSVVRVDRLDRATNLPDFSLSSICDQLTRYFKGTRASFRTRNCRSFDILWLKNEIIKKIYAGRFAIRFSALSARMLPVRKVRLNGRRATRWMSFS